MSDDFCAVCAEPLEFVAYQKCGHKDTCSKCVARLRFVLNDRRCVICQQSDSAVVVTRFSGDYTATVPAAEFDRLKVELPAVTALHEVAEHACGQCTVRACLANLKGEACAMTS